MIRALEEGPAAETTAPEILQEQYAYIKEAVASVRGYRDLDKSNVSLKEKEDDLGSKKIALNVYINCTLLISRTFALKGWKSFEIRLQRISLRMASRPSSKVRSQVLAGRVRTAVGSSSEDRVSKRLHGLSSPLFRSLKNCIHLISRVLLTRNL